MKNKVYQVLLISIIILISTSTVINATTDYSLIPKTEEQKRQEILEQGIDLTKTQEQKRSETQKSQIDVTKLEKALEDTSEKDIDAYNKLKQAQNGQYAKDIYEGPNQELGSIVKYGEIGGVSQLKFVYYEQDGTKHVEDYSTVADLKVKHPIKSGLGFYDAYSDLDRLIDGNKKISKFKNPAGVSADHVYGDDYSNVGLQIAQWAGLMEDKGDLSSVSAPNTATPDNPVPTNNNVKNSNQNSNNNANNSDTRTASTEPAGNGERVTTLTEIINNANGFIRDGENGEQHISQEQLRPISNTIYSVLLTIGIILAVGIGMVLGIKFVLGSVEEKAEIKTMLVPYVVGCIVIFSAFGIWKLVVDVLQTM